jgi:hypothetical protein
MRPRWRGVESDQLPEWLRPTTPRHWLLAYAHDEDSVVDPRVGEQVRFLPEVTTHVEFRGGAMFPLWDPIESDARFLVGGATVRVRARGTFHASEPAHVLIDGVPVVRDGVHDFEDGADVFVDGSLELPTWDDWTIPGVLLPAWSVRAIARVERAQDGSPRYESVRACAHPDEASHWHVVLCELQLT